MLEKQPSLTTEYPKSYTVGSCGLVVCPEKVDTVLDGKHMLKVIFPLFVETELQPISLASGIKCLYVKAFGLSARILTSSCHSKFEWPQ